MSDDISESLFPGIYNIYAYGLVEKTETSKKVYSYSIKKNLECFENSKNDILLDFTILTPSAEIIIEDPIDTPILKVYIEGISDIFSLSSLSVKQGSDRVRSVDFERHDDTMTYTAPVPIYENGDWYMNISYSLKSSKKDEDALDADDIYISTSYFKDIFLGEFNLL